MSKKLSVAILGSTGYVGLELIKILSNHPKVKIVYLCAQKSIGKSTRELIYQKGEQMRPKVIQKAPKGRPCPGGLWARSAGKR